MQNLWCLDPFFLPPYTRGERRKTIWSELESNPGPLTSQATALTTTPSLLGLKYQKDPETARYLVSEGPKGKPPLLLPHVAVAEDDAVGVDGLVGGREEGFHDGLEVLRPSGETLVLEGPEQTKKSKLEEGAVAGWSKASMGEINRGA